MSPLDWCVYITNVIVTGLFTGAVVAFAISLLVIGFVLSSKLIFKSQTNRDKMVERGFLVLVLSWLFMLLSPYPAILN